LIETTPTPATRYSCFSIPWASRTESRLAQAAPAASVRRGRGAPSESPDRRPAENRATRRLNSLREAPAAIDFTPFLTHF